MPHPTSTQKLLVLLLTAAGVASLILLGGVEFTVRTGLVLFLCGLLLLAAWSLARSNRLTLRTLDEATWALLICHTVMVARIRDPRVLAEEGSITPQILAEITIWCLCLAYVALRLTRDPGLSSTLGGPAARFSSLFFLLALTSATYAASPRITLAWCLKLLTILGVATVLFDSKNPLDSISRFLRATQYGLILMLLQFVILGLYSPESAYGQSGYTGIVRLGGYLLPSTQLSAVGGLICVRILIELLAGRRPRFGITVLVLAMGFALASLGRTGLFSTFLTIAFILAAYRRVRMVVVAATAAVIILLAFPEVSQTTWELASRRQDQSQILSLTGRVQLWETALELISEKPILGWGYVSGSRVALLSAFRLWPAPHSHNAFLETLLTLGILGLVLMLALIYRTISILIAFLRARWSAVRPPVDVADALTLICFVLLLATDGMLSAGFGGAPRFETSILIGCAFASDRLRQVYSGRAQ